MVRAPGEKPSLHIVVLNVVAGGELAIRLADFREHSLLIGNVRLDGIGD